jgi:hypothetical protein
MEKEFEAWEQASDEDLEKFELLKGLRVDRLKEELPNIPITGFYKESYIGGQLILLADVELNGPPFIKYYCDGFGVAYDGFTRQIVGLVATDLEELANEPFIQENPDNRNSGE